MSQSWCSLSPVCIFLTGHHDLKIGKPLPLASEGLWGIHENSQDFAASPGQFPRLGGGIRNCVLLSAVL